MQKVYRSTRRREWTDQRRAPFGAASQRPRWSRRRSLRSIPSPFAANSAAGIFFAIFDMGTTTTDRPSACQGHHSYDQVTSAQSARRRCLVSRWPALPLVTEVALKQEPSLLDIYLSIAFNRSRS